MLMFVLQEWQNSIQKNAGLAFIELVNEGRQVTPTCLSSCSSTKLSLQPPFISHFPISPSSDRIVPLLHSGTRDPQGPCNMVAVQDNNQWLKSAEGLRGVRMEDRCVQGSIQYLLIPVGLGERKRVQVEGDRSSECWFLCNTWEIALNLPLGPFCLSLYLSATISVFQLFPHMKLHFANKRSPFLLWLLCSIHTQFQVGRATLSIIDPQLLELAEGNPK